jgi:hypothetical protein
MVMVKMTLQEFGLSYPYFGGYFPNDYKCIWTKEEIEECLGALNKEIAFDGYDFSRLKEPREVVFLGKKYLIHFGFWTDFLAFPVEESPNLYLLQNPRTRKDVDDYTNWIVKYYEQLRKKRGETT